LLVRDIIKLGEDKIVALDLMSAGKGTIPWPAIGPNCFAARVSLWLFARLFAIADGMGEIHISSYTKLTHPHLLNVNG
jgi:hypothetical protein